jgi:hypothetical protein
MSEFDGTTRDALHTGLNAYLRPDETPAEDAKKLEDDRLRVKHVLGLRANDATKDDRDFLARMIQQGLAGL